MFCYPHTFREKAGIMSDSLYIHTSPTNVVPQNSSWTIQGGENTKMAPSKSTEESDACMRQRLVDSLSSSFPGSALSKALHAMDSDDDVKCEDPLSSSCFAELRLEKCDTDEDEELTSLSWLQDNDLLKNINGGEDVLEESSCGDLQTENGDIKMENNMSPQNHPPNIPYNPQKHINSKPPYSFSCLIFMAVEDSPMKRLPVKDIYSWILTHFPYFQNAPTGWKNSVRHNLSLNKCFKKVDKDKGQNIGKGSLWMVDPDYRPNLLQALRKTPYHPYHQLQMLASPQSTVNYTLLPGTPRTLPLSARLNLNTPSPHLFPFLSRRLAHSKVDTETDIDVANTLVSLKTSPAWRNLDNRFKPLSAVHNDRSVDYNRDSRSPSPPEFGSDGDRYRNLKRKYGHLTRPSSPIICTSSPSEDHTYSVSSQQGVPLRVRSSTEYEECEFGPEDDYDCTDTDSEYEESEEDENIAEKMSGIEDCGLPAKRRLVIAEGNNEEEMKIVEGADALLNLAGIKVPLRSISPLVNKNIINNNNNNNHIKVEVNS